MTNSPPNSQTILSVFAAFLFILFGSYLAAQDSNRAGLWKGVLEAPGFELQMDIELQQKENTWQGLLDIPQQGITDMDLVDLRITADSIHFRLPEVPGNANYSGAFLEDKEIKGIFRQAGQTLNLVFVKEDAEAKKAEESRVAAIVEKLSQMADTIIQKQNLPGIGFGIFKDGEVVMAKGYGKRDVENEVPVTANTMFAIGSCSKAFTAMGLAMLVEDGKLEWDRPVIEYMNDFQLFDDFATREMTAVDLLTHQSGLPRHDLMWYGSPLDRYELYSRLKHLPPTESFRSAWQYQNLMYMTAGILLEKISGKTWEEFTQERIFNPLQMNSSLFSWDNIPDDMDVALGYSNQDDKLVKIPYRDIDNVAPAGSIVSNVNEMLHWVEFLLDHGKFGGNEIVKPATINFIHQAHKVVENSESPNNPEFSFSSYGLGWGIGYYRGEKIVTHSGGIDGFAAYVLLVPGKNIGMVLLTNMGNGGGNVVLARTAVDLLLENEATDWYTRIFGEESEEDEEDEQGEEKQKKPVPDTQPSHALEDYTGTYEHPGYGTIEIDLVNDSLNLAFNAFAGRLEHWHYDVFKFELPFGGMSLMISFHSNQDGYIHRLSVPLETTLDESFNFEKLPPDLMSDEYLSRIMGEYKLNSDGTGVSVSKTGEKLFVTIVGQPPYELEAYQADEFNLKSLNGFSVKFYFDDAVKGDATYLEFLQPNGIFRADRQNEEGD